MNEQQQIGARIRVARTAAGLTQLQLAMRVRLARSAISMLGSGSRRPQPTELSRVADALGVPEAELRG